MIHHCLSGGSVSELVDARTRFEMYYPVFEGAAKASESTTYTIVSAFSNQS